MAQSNSQLAHPALTIAPLAVSDTHLVPVQPLFLQKLSDTLGDHLTPVDGFDDLLNTPLSLIDPESATVTALDTSTADAAFTAGDFATGALDPIAHDISAFNDGGDTILGDFNQNVAPPAQPATPAAPAPGAPPPAPSGGGGGGNPGFSNQRPGDATFSDPSGDWASFWKGVK
jgi:hypothetical protein